MKTIKRIFAVPGLIPVVICLLVAFLDVSSKWTFSKTSIGGYCFILMRALCWGLLLGSPAVLIGKWSRWLYVPLLPCILINGAIESYTKSQFDMNYTGDWILVLKITSVDEIRGFFYGNVMQLSFYVILLVFAVWLVVRMIGRSPYPRVSWKSAMIAVLMVVPEFASGWGGCRAVMFPWVVYDTWTECGMLKDLGYVHGHPEGLDSVELAVPLANAPTCVIVIGESATRNDFGVYGYNRPTTPFLSSNPENLFVYTDLVGSWHSTLKALRYLFTGANAEDQAHARVMISQICRKAGYKQTFITNVSRLGCVNSVNTIGCMFDYADEFICLEDLDLPHPRYDEAMLPYCRKAMCGGGVVYLHQSGCHYPFAEAYPKSRAFFNDGTPLDHYDNGIRYLDYILGEIISSLKELHRPAMLFYISDHGETPRAKNWRAFSDPDLWELPMIVWFSDEYKEQFPETVSRVAETVHLPLQSDQVLPGLLKMMQINGWQDSESEKCFLNSSFVPRKRRFIKAWSESYERH